jgi:hypothetical protein
MANADKRHRIVRPTNGPPHCLCGWKPQPTDDWMLPWHIDLLNWYDEWAVT